MDSVKLYANYVQVQSIMNDKMTVVQSELKNEN